MTRPHSITAALLLSLTLTLTAAVLATHAAAATSPARVVPAQPTTADEVEVHLTFLAGGGCQYLVDTSRRIEKGQNVIELSGGGQGPCAMAFPEQVRKVKLGRLAAGTYVVKGPRETLRFQVNVSR